MALQASDIQDIVTTSLNDLGRGKMTDIMSTYQDTTALKRFLKKDKMTFDSGPNLAFNLITGTNDSARWVPLYGQDQINVPNVMTTGQIPWRHFTYNWAYDEREPFFNAGASKIVDIIKTREVAAKGAAVKQLEYDFWRVPASTDTVTMYGVPYYIVKSNTATTTNDGFNGTVPSGYTTVAGISPTTYDKWRNYATQYTAISKTDFIRKLRRMAKYTDFKPLVDNIKTYDRGKDRVYCTNYTVLYQLEEILESQNENLGNDLASKDGQTMMHRHNVEFVKELDLDTTDPFYQIDFGVFGCVAQSGRWMKQVVIQRQAGQHTVGAVHTDSSMNVICYDRRKLGVLATNTTMGY